MKRLLLFFLFLPVLLCAQTITPIANIQDSISVYNGQIVTIEGVITIGAGMTHGTMLNAFIQDQSGKGLMLFDYDITTAYYQDLIRGNRVQVTGEVEDYNGVTEIKDFNYDVISSGNPEPPPIILDLGQNLNSYEGTLVQVIGEIYEVYSSGGGTNLNIEDINENQITIRVWDSTGIDVTEFTVGYILEARGVGGLYQSTFQILPGYQDHLEEGEFDNYPYGDISDRIPGETVTITFSYPFEFESVLLYWKTASDANFKSTEMDTISVEADYQAIIPGQSEGTTVQFYISAVDMSGVSYLFPENYPDDPPYDYQYEVTSHKAVLNIPAKPFNPYAGETFPIEFASQIDDKAILRIYNAEGKLVFEPQNIIISGQTGITHYDWDGRDKENKLLPLGLYICFLEIIEIDSGNKKTAKAPIVIGAPLD